MDIWMVGPVEFTPLAGAGCRKGKRAAGAEAPPSEAEGGVPVGASVAADMLSRDLTVNAAAFDEEGRLSVHPRFYEDLSGRVLRLASGDALTNDPLRVFRVARFAAELPDFSLAPETLEGMRALARTRRELLADIPRERVGRELMKAFAAPKPSRFLTVLQEGDCLRPWFEELAPAADIPAGPSPWHDNSVLEHTMEVMDRCAGNPLAVWMALCHDLGKVRTDQALLPHHYGHETRGVELVKALGNRLCLPSRWIRAGVVGTVLHMKGGMYGTLRSGTRRDLLCQLRDAHIGHEFWLLAGADGGWDWEPMAERDRNAMEKVHLPKEWRDRGTESGQRLRALQCEAISRLPKFRPERAANAGDTPVPAHMKED